jgi:hypothetical protein
LGTLYLFFILIGLALFTDGGAIGLLLAIFVGVAGFNVLKEGFADDD